MQKEDHSIMVSVNIVFVISLNIDIKSFRSCVCIFFKYLEFMVKISFKIKSRIFYNLIFKTPYIQS